MNQKPEGYITIALPKGRILEESMRLFKGIGVNCQGILEDSRKLLWEDKHSGIKFIMVRDKDVPTYVEYGAADMGIAGKDVLIEQGRDIYEPLDLQIGHCRMVVAEPKELVKGDDPSHWSYIRVATKFPRITERHFLSKGIQVELIELYGSIELAPLVGLSERIVDIVSTGETLRKNGLVEVEDIMKITSRLITNKASLKTNYERINEIIEGLRELLE
ncbi:MAG: ATP phosphoribosyltransferase [Thermodesulfobacteriota bacterium]